MNLQAFEIYKQEVMNKVTGAHIHEVTGCLATIRNYISISPDVLSEFEKRKVEAGIKRAQKRIFDLIRVCY